MKWNEDGTRTHAASSGHKFTFQRWFSISQQMSVRSEAQKNLKFLGSMLTMSRTLNYSVIFSELLPHPWSFKPYCQNKVHIIRSCVSELMSCIATIFLYYQYWLESTCFYEFCKFSLQWDCILLNSGLLCLKLLNTDSMIMPCIMQCLIWHENIPICHIFLGRISLVPSKHKTLLLGCRDTPLISAIQEMLVTGH